MHDQQRLSDIAHARQAMLHEGQSATDALVQLWFDRAWLLPSWQRCLARGQRPEQAVGFDLVPAAARQRAQDEHHALLQAARAPLQRLARMVAPIRYFALLTDAAGQVIDTAGAIDHHDRRAHAIARVGVDLSERCIGTSAIGAALAEQQPVWLHRGEHFFRDTSVYSCAGAPVTGPDGRCLGMIDLTGIDAPERPELKHLVARSAREVEDALVLATPHRLRLHLAWSHLAGEDGADALLCLDSGGAVVSANAAARAMLPALHAPAGRVVHADELFALRCALLFDHAGHDAPLQVPLWSGLRLAVRAHWADGAAGTTAARPLRQRETELIHQAVRDAHGNVAQAARALGLSRATVYRRLSTPQGVGGDGGRHE